MVGQVEAMQTQLGALFVDLSHVDAAIRVFRPDIELADLPEKIAPGPFTGFRGEIQRFLLDELRRSNEPLSTFDLAEHIMRKRGLDPADRLHFKLITKRTGYALAKLRNKGEVASKRTHRSAPLNWTLATRE
jgi:hypothetical protein